MFIKRKVLKNFQKGKKKIELLVRKGVENPKREKIAIIH